MKKSSGFTLVELMVTLAVGIIVLSIGIPAFTSLMSSNQMTAYANGLNGALRFARDSAINNGDGDSVTICASNSDQTGCSGTDWNNGWLVFVDVDDGDDLDAGEEILRVWSTPSDERSSLVFAGGAPAAIRFLPSGKTAAGTALSLSLKKSDCHANQARKITISVTGRSKVEHLTCF